jgi:hypothetical protein
LSGNSVENWAFSPVSFMAFLKIPLYLIRNIQCGPVIFSKISVMLEIIVPVKTAVN